MVCEKCEKKKLKGKNTAGPSGLRYEAEGGNDKVGANKILANKKQRYQPYKETTFGRCRICRQHVHNVHSRFCQGCAYYKGICAICGTKMYDTKNYKQSVV